MKDAKILLGTNMNKGDSVMYQIKVNGILLPQIYWSMREARTGETNRLCDY